MGMLRDIFPEVGYVSDFLRERQQFANERARGLFNRESLPWNWNALPTPDMNAELTPEMETRAKEGMTQAVGDAFGAGITKSFPDVVKKAFGELGRAQRGLPEDLMVKAQHTMGGGVLNPVIEHTGDLTHRMAHMVEWPRPSLGREYVLDKTEKVLRYLRSGYGFQRELVENIKNNADYRKVEFRDLLNKTYSTLDEYAAAHQELPVYNRAQWLGREAAVAVGKRDWQKAERLLEELHELAKDEDTWDQAAGAFDLDGDTVLQWMPRKK